MYGNFFIWLRREQEKKVAKKPVNIEYVAPQSQTGKKYDDKIESLQKLLSKELKAPVNIQRTTSDYKMIEDLASKKWMWLSCRQ